MSYFHLGAEAENSGSALTIRAINAGGVVGGTCYALCDANGSPLPSQTECHIDNPSFGEIGFVIAKFHIDGSRVKIAA